MIDHLLNNGARGAISTECIIPDSFASSFIVEFYARLLKGVQIGDALFETRKFLLTHPTNNPLGLLYALYANPGTRFVNYGEKLP